MLMNNFSEKELADVGCESRCTKYYLKIYFLCLCNFVTNLHHRIFLYIDMYVVGRQRGGRGGGSMNEMVASNYTNTSCAEMFFKYDFDCCLCNNRTRNLKYA